MQWSKHNHAYKILYLITLSSFPTPPVVDVTAFGSLFCFRVLWAVRYDGSNKEQEASKHITMEASGERKCSPSMLQSPIYFLPSRIRTCTDRCGEPCCSSCTKKQWRSLFLGRTYHHMPSTETSLTHHRWPPPIKKVEFDGWRDLVFQATSISPLFLRSSLSDGEPTHPVIDFWSCHRGCCSRLPTLCTCKHLLRAEGTQQCPCMHGTHTWGSHGLVNRPLPTSDEIKINNFIEGSMRLATPKWPFTLQLTPRKLPMDLLRCILNFINPMGCDQRRKLPLFTDAVTYIGNLFHIFKMIPNWMWRAYISLISRFLSRFDAYKL